MSQIAARALLGVFLATILPSCFGAPEPVRAMGPVILTYQPPPAETAVGPTPVTSVNAYTQDRGSVIIKGFHEPPDWAHRNYCGAGATQVLLSAWLTEVPDIETIARQGNLNPSVGMYGIDTARAINYFLAPVVTPVLGRPRYQAEHVTSLDAVKTRIRRDLLDPEAIKKFGHGVPVMVQVMTKTMPGWNRWNATHMFTIFAFDFTHNDPGLDTVTYVETPSPVAGYRGPDVQIMTLTALWTAMDAYNVEYPQDPLNVIS